MNKMDRMMLIQEKIELTFDQYSISTKRNRLFETMEERDIYQRYYSVLNQPNNLDD
jgi:hypothetical protein